MSGYFVRKKSGRVVPIYAFSSDQLSSWLEGQAPMSQRWVKSTGFKAKSGSVCLIPDSEGQVEQVLLGIQCPEDFWSFGGLARQLPFGVYALDAKSFVSDAHFFRAHLAWGLGQYQFSAYKSREEADLPCLLLGSGIDADLLECWVESICLGRNWINTPAEDMNPERLAEAIHIVARDCQASVSTIVGDDLLAQNYPAIHAVGRGASIAPRFVELNWGEAHHPSVTLVGKGVCFDTGGLDLKPAANMRWMKKDMSGAAHALVLARLIMKQKLPVRLRLLVPAVENAIGNTSYRPGDVVKTRAGLQIEIHNTDAEGRMVLCDALAAAVEQKPDLLIDFSTLTGAASVALGPDIPAFYANQNDLVTELMNASHEQIDPIWSMPLYQPYNEMLKSQIADHVNCSTEPFAGSITAALYLQKFVPDNVPWIHFDFGAWNYVSRPGRPKGGEVLALRSVFSFLQKRIAK